MTEDWKNSSGAYLTVKSEWCGTRRTTTEVEQEVGRGCVHKTIQWVPHLIAGLFYGNALLFSSFFLYVKHVFRQATPSLPQLRAVRNVMLGIFQLNSESSKAPPSLGRVGRGRRRNIGFELGDTTSKEAEEEEPHSMNEPNFLLTRVWEINWKTHFERFWHCVPELTPCYCQVVSSQKKTCCHKDFLGEIFVRRAFDEHSASVSACSRLLSAQSIHFHDEPSHSVTSSQITPHHTKSMSTFVCRGLRHCLFGTPLDDFLYGRKVVEWGTYRSRNKPSNPSLGSLCLRFLRFLFCGHNGPLPAPSFLRTRLGRSIRLKAGKRGPRRLAQTLSSLGGGGAPLQKLKPLFIRAYTSRAAPESIFTRRALPYLLLIGLRPLPCPFLPPHRIPSSFFRFSWFHLLNLFPALERSRHEKDSPAQMAYVAYGIPQLAAIPSVAGIGVRGETAQGWMLTTSGLQLVTKTKKVFIGGLSATSTLEDMKAYFESYGKVEDAMLMYDKATQRHRGGIGD